MSEPDGNGTRRPRGRPRIFDQDHEAIFRNLFPEIRTHRGRQNHMYSSRAIRVLNEAAGEWGERFAWLIGPSRAEAKIRFTIMTELGRIEDPGSLVAVADVLCTEKHPTRLAVALIRQRVRKKGKAQPTVADATKYLAGAVDEWFKQYPDADAGVMLEALNEIYCITQDMAERTTQVGRQGQEGVP